MAISSRARRVAAAVALAAVVGAGLAVHLLAPTGAGGDIAGDALYAAAAYAALVLVLPRLRPVVVAAAAGGWCVAVELFQLTGLPREWGAMFRPAALVLGSGFDARDLIVYIAAVVVAAGVDALATRRWLPRRR